MAQKTLSLYLAKPDVEDFDDVLTENARNRIGRRGTQIIEAGDFANGARLYVFVGMDVPPRWLADLRPIFDIGGQIETCSACAVLVFRVADRVFVSTFAHGWMYLDEENVEGDFGLRVALNSLNDRKLRRLERANLADALRGTSQSPFQREFTSFGLDDALDLIRKISGKTHDGSSADALTGSRSLKLTGEFAVADLPDLAIEALEQFASVEYRSTSFRVIDFVTPVVDARTIIELDLLAAERIREGADEFELGLPETGETDSVAYAFVGPRARGQHADLRMADYVAALGNNLPQLTPATLRDHKVRAIYDAGLPEQKWSIRFALLGSLVLDSGRYAINEGEWYRIDDAFKRSIEELFVELRDVWHDRPIPLRRISDVRGRRTVYQTEASYNADLAERTGYCLLDTQLIQIEGVQRSGFEPCDLLDIQGKRFIHVKKSSRRSSILSHFFKQGANSARQFSRFPDAWRELRLLVNRIQGEEAAAQLDAAIADTERPWTVEYLIADAPRANGEFNIPFFSKITLRDETIDLRAMQYRVALRFIGL